MEIAPVVLICFNRPNEVLQVFNRIRKAKVPKLYIVMDGPREGNAEDIELTKKVKEIVTNVDWECEVKTNISEKNLGCGPRPQSGISWVFEQEDRAIILEDDCVPSMKFFEYCSELLEKYYDNERIMHISGTLIYKDYKFKNSDSYLFSRYQNNVGWATWRRAWKYYDFNLSNLPSVLERKYLDLRFSKDEALYWKNKFINASKMNRNIWDYQWQYTIFMNAGVCIFPRKNLISNIDPCGTTSPTYDEIHYFQDIDDEFNFMNHPNAVCINDDFDQYFSWKRISEEKQLKNKIKRKLKKIFIPWSVRQKKAKIKLDEKKQMFYNHYLK
ncbi:MAG: hypothetical protein JXB49_31095 [Bacteroidales bacterium]|nr:hypothetical protein [Bacteroidales bacterium]MBN2820713.1 hypothetical protein [Bacteroidales bacterium]